MDSLKEKVLTMLENRLPKSDRTHVMGVVADCIDKCASNGAAELAAAIKKDPELREAYVANIAMAFKDNYGWHKKESGRSVMNNQDIHDIANKAANYFIDQFLK